LEGEDEGEGGLGRFTLTLSRKRARGWRTREINQERYI
jgi:hypothetical protein